MVDTGGIFAGLIFVAAVAGLLAVNEIDYVSSYQSVPNPEISEISENSQDEIVRTVNYMTAQVELFFSDLKDNLGFL